MKNRAISFILALLLILSLLPGFALADGESGLREDVCAAIAEGIRNWDEEIDLCEYEITVDEYKKNLSAVLDTHPEFFYVVKADCTASVSDGYVMSISPAYDRVNYNEDDMAVFNSTCTAIIDSIPEGTTEEKLLYIHDYIITHCEYDESLEKYSAYDCLVGGSAVCEGYARAFMYLSQLARLDVHFVGSENMAHAWNVAKISNTNSPEGAYYYIDCTFDDPLGNYNVSHCNHDNFLMNIEKTRVEHPTSDWTNEFGELIISAYSSDETYRTYWWTNLIRPVQWVGNLMCYAKGSDRSHVFFRESGSSSETALSLPASVGNGGNVYWNVWNEDSYYSKSFITVAAFGGCFYFSTPTQIWKLTTGRQMSLTYTLNATEQSKGYIYALRVQDGKLVYDLATNPEEGPVYTGTLNLASVAITSQPASTTATPGSTVSFKVVASGSGLNYQWQASTDGGTTWANSGANGSKTATLSFTAAAAHNGYKFRCKVTGSGGQYVISNAATLTIAGAAPVITTQPKNVTATAGSTASFTVAATGASTYQWQASTDGGTTWANSGANGSKTATLSFTAAAAHNNYKFRCVVKNSSGGQTVSSAATLTVTAITTQPKDVTATAGSTVKFTVAATGASSYQWQVSTDGGTTWANSGAGGNKTATLSFTATAAHNGYQFRCKVTGSGGQYVISKEVKLTVNY